MAQIPGKRTRFVPVLILTPVRQSMDILVHVCTEMNLVPENDYFFASDSSDGHLSSYKVLRHCTQDARLRFPTRARSTQTFESIWPLSLGYLLELLVFVSAIYWSYCDLDLCGRFIHDLQ